MSSQYGKKLKISIFGQSHSPAIGVNIDGLPAGIALNMDALHAFLARRAPGQSELATERKEDDTPEILSGLVNGVTCGAPLTAIIRNKDTRSADYHELCDIPRPSHADYSAHVKYGGNQDVAGGGHFSGRLTAPLCVAGGICLQILHTLGIEIGAHILRIGGAEDSTFDPVRVSVADFTAIQSNPLPVMRRSAGDAMRTAILAAKEKGDSVGGVIECAAIGLPSGLGDPIFDGIENRIASIVFGIPAVKGIEFGNGFAAAERTGSQNNDSFYMEADTVKTRTNNSGGILGGITNGMPVLFRAAFKPTPSIALEQKSISLSRREDTVLQIKGRHDPCIVPRAVPCVEAAAAIALYDTYLDNIMLNK
ncbi:MAG: chorismate synthase [Treponema sp.]|jgi:chorismate synthase|nr:chorismate synthase [Treponema sp.]